MCYMCPVTVQMAERVVVPIEVGMNTWTVIDLPLSVASTVEQVTCESKEIQWCDVLRSPKVMLSFGTEYFPSDQV